MDQLNYNKIKNITVSISLHNGDEYEVIGINKFKQLYKQLETSNGTGSAPMKKKIIIDDDSEEYFRQPHLPNGRQPQDGPKKIGFQDTYSKARQELERYPEVITSIPSDPNAVNLERNKVMNLNYAPVSGGVLNGSDMSRIIASGGVKF